MSCSPKKVAKVALLLHDLEEGGMQSVCLKLVQAFCEHPNVEVELVLSNQAGGFLHRVPDTVPMINLGLPFQLTLRYIVNLTVGLSKYLRQSQPDIILSNLPYVNFITQLAKMLALSSVFTILVEHTLPLKQSLQREGESTLGQRFIAIATTMMRLLYPHAGYMVVPSQGLAKELVQAVRLKPHQSHRLKVVSNPVVDQQLFAKAQAPLEHPWLQPGQPPVILAVGRFTPQKDYETLLQGFALLNQDVDARLMILGDGPMRDQLEALVKTLGLDNNVTLPGFVDNPYAYMERAAMFVLSSVWETFGVVLVEALACGCPVVSTRCDYGPAEILEDGKYGSLVPVKNASALAEAMKAVLVNLERDPNKLKTRAQAFSLDQAAQNYLTLMGVEH